MRVGNKEVHRVMSSMKKGRIKMSGRKDGPKRYKYLTKVGYTKKHGKRIPRWAVHKGLINQLCTLQYTSIKPALVFGKLRPVRRLDLHEIFYN